MSTSAPEHPRGTSVAFREEMLVVQLADGREVAVPLEWFPRLRKATPGQLANWRFIGRGVGIHWPDLDEHLSVRGLLMPEAAQLRRSA